MKRWTLTLVTIVAVAMLGVALAQEVIPPVDLDPRTWFANPFALAGVVLAFTGFIRTQLKTQGFVTLAVSFGSGIALAFAATLNLPYFGQLYTGTFGEAIVLGATAAVIASGGWDVVKGLLLEAITKLGKQS